MSSPPRDKDALLRAAQTLVKNINANSLLVKNLQNICHVNGLSRTGVKAELQRRIIKKINDIVAREDFRAFQEIERSVNSNSGFLGFVQPSQPSSQYYSSSPSSNATHAPLSSPYGHQSTTYMPSPRAYSMSNGGLNGNRAQALPQQGGLFFKESPFYKIVQPIGDIKVCDVMSQHRNNISIPLRLSDRPELQQCIDDTMMRVMVFCAADGIGLQDIAFPHQAELKVNGGEIKANLRGLKNKPGSTRPVDITEALRLRPQYGNSIDFTYALTQKGGSHPNSMGRAAEKFYLGVYLCKTTSVEVLARQIASGQRIRKATVISDMTKKAQDPDVVATSQVLSLKCPLSYMRLGLPCRSLNCTHLQCFDATSYLQLQEQGPQWVCPVCNKSAPFAQLAVDEYVRDILQNTSSSVEQVTIEPDGRWHTQEAQRETDVDGPDLSFVHDEDGVIASADVSIVGAWSTATPNRSTNSIGTPLTAFSRESSSMPPRSATSSKRPAAEVIDLTLSDDEEEEPIQPPPAKRLNTRMDYPFTFD